MNPAVEKTGDVFGSALVEEASKIEEDNFLLAPVVFSPDKKIYFHGGDFLPFTHLPMPWAGDELWIGQYPELREVNFIPLFAFLMPEKLYQEMDVPEKFGDNVVDHAEFIMQAKQLGAKCYVTPDVHCVWPHAYKPQVGAVKFRKQVEADLKKFEKRWSGALDREYKYPVVVQSIVTFAGGYNVHSFNFLKQLFKKKIRTYYHFIGGTNEDEGASTCPFIDDFKTQYGSMKLPQVTLCHGTNNFKNSGEYKIGYSTTEVSGIPKDWVQCFNELDEVWTTSDYAKKSFADSGVEVPIYVVREGIDPAYFHPDIAPFANPPEQSFKFLANFAWGRRKGADLLFEAFRKEFDEDEDVCMMVKVLPSYSGHKIKEELKNVYDREGSAPVTVYDIELQKYELGRLYTMADAFLWPSRGEGFGLPPLEALACGVPVVATDHSSHTEFLKENGKARPGVLLIDGEVVPYDKGDSIYYPGFDWFEPDLDHFRKQMREVYENHKKYKEEALETSKVMRKEWTWSKGAEKAVERLEDIYQDKWKIS